MIFRSIVAGALALALSASLALAQTNPGSSPLTPSKGGTNSAFVGFTGPATSVKTFTLPNASDTIATLAAIQTFSAAKTFNSATLLLAGSSSGAGTLNAPAAASTYVWTLPTVTDTLVSKTSSDTLTNKTFDTAGTGNSFSINGLAATANTGTGSVVRATSPSLTTPALGTPSALVLTNATGLPVSTGISGLASGIASWLATSSSANLATAVTDETGSGALVFGTSPSLTTPSLGTPSTLTLTNATGLPVSTGVSGFGTGVATALAVNVGSAGAPVVNGGALGTPSSGTATNITGLPIATGVSGLGSNVATFLATASSANLRAALSDEVGTGAAYFVGGALGTPASGTATNLTGLPVSTGISGLGTGVATALAVNVGSAGAPVVNGGALGTPSSGTLTSATGLPVSTGISGLASGIASWLATSSSANLATALTDETGSGAAVFGTAPTLVNAIVGTQSAGDNSTKAASTAYVDTLGALKANAANAALTGSTDVQGTFKMSSFVTATQITSSQNDYTATDGSNTCSAKTALRISSNGALNVTGLSCAQAEGDLRVLHNVGANDIVLKNQDGSSAAGNRFLLAGDMTLAADTSVTIRYDGQSTKWRAITTPGAGGGGGGGVTSIACAEGALCSTITTTGTVKTAFYRHFMLGGM